MRKYAVKLLSKILEGSHLLWNQFLCLCSILEYNWVLIFILWLFQLNDVIAEHSEKDRRCTSQSQEILTLSDQVQKLSTELKLVSSAKDDLTHNVRTCVFQSISRISYDSHFIFHLRGRCIWIINIWCYFTHSIFNWPTGN